MTAPKKTAAKKAPAKRAARKTIKPRPEVTPPSDSMTMIRVGNQDYPLRSVASCHTCQSPHRRWIENEVVLGRSYTGISQRLETMPRPEGAPSPSVGSLRAHVTGGHTPTPASVRRRIVDRRAQQLGQKILDEESVVDYVVVNDTILQMGYERLVSGEMKVSASELLTAIANQHKIEQTSDNGYDAEVYQQAMIEYMEVAMGFIPRDQRAAYGAALNRSPVLKALAARMAGEEPQTVDQDGTPVE